MNVALISGDELALLIQQKCEKAYRKVLSETNICTPYPVKEFFTEPEAREFLGGISRSLFHKLKNQGKFSTYHCREGRCLYSREELVEYIRNNKPANK